MESISAFEMIKIGIGPSSSHTMGPWIAARRFLDEIPELATVQSIEVRLYGSLAKTGAGHGTDVAILMGLSGLDYATIDTSTIADRVDRIKAEGKLLLGGRHEIPFIHGHDLIFDSALTLPRHANGMRFRALLSDETDMARTYYSLGGGFVAGDEPSPTDDVPKTVTPHPCHSGAELVRTCHRLGLSVAELTRLNEQAWRSRDAVEAQALALWEEIKASVFRGVNSEGYLPGGLRVRRRSAEINRRLLGAEHYHSLNGWLALLKRQPRDFTRVNKWISCFALAVNEENASFGRIVTAPTNGAAGVIPAVLLYAWCFLDGIGTDHIVRFILVAGEIGTLFKKNATISAAMGGCQAEVGVSSAMAAAGLAEILGGSPEQVVQAAEIAMEHHLGLTCDPVGGLVQIPCIERNCMGAIKAITAANIALE
ncbi:MAG: L-serine ammonia-lyase, partial [Methylococcaceae bacterium]|nr:L-serine ammonia-lyase [Methylococcaceae bacterium]